MQTTKKKNKEKLKTSILDNPTNISKQITYFAETSSEISIVSVGGGKKKRM